MIISLTTILGNNFQFAASRVIDDHLFHPTDPDYYFPINWDSIKELEILPDPIKQPLEQHLATIDTARELSAEIQRKLDKLSKLLDPVLQVIVGQNDKDEMIRLYHLLPNGFHRSELHTLLIEKGWRP